MESLSNSELIKQIKRYQYNIQQVNPPENDAQRVLHYIRKLSKLPIKLGELEKTGVGKTINALRKRPGSIGEEATLLVAKWKCIARKQVQEEESAAEQRKRSHDSHSDYESSGSDLKSNVSKESRKIRVEVQKNESEKAVKEVKLKTSKHTSDKLGKDSVARKRKHSSDVEEKVAKKSKHIKLESMQSTSEEENYFPPDVKVKQEIPSKLVKNEDKRHENERKKRKEKEKLELEKSHKKDQHDKKHHKSDKHKDEKSHRHHSKSSHEKKRDSAKSDVDKYRADKKSESKSRRDSEKRSSSSRKDSKSNSKHYSSDEPVTSTTGSRNDRNGSDDSDTYHDYSIKMENTQPDDDFGAALLSISQTSPAKKKSTPSKYSSVHSSPATNSPQNSGSDFDTISSSVKLEPLDDMDLELKEDSYNSNHDYSREKTSYRLKHISAEEAANSMYTTKNQRTKVFSGFKSKFNVKFPSLFELCVRVLQDNFDALEYTGGVPYDVLKPILEKVTVEQLYTFENHNPYLIGETDELWECHAKKHFRSAKRQELETWRDVYLRCVEEREEKLQSLTENISQSIANSTPVRKTKLAYFDSVVKPPRNVARSQAKHGTGQISAKRSPKGPQPSQAAVLSVKDRLARESMAAPVAIGSSSKNLLTKKKKAPLMQKTLQQLKGLKR